jgi:hypothetical protein
MTPRLRVEVIRRYQGGAPSRVVAEEQEIGTATVLKTLKSQSIPVRPIGARYWNGLVGASYNLNRHGPAHLSSTAMSRSAISS